MAQKEEYGALTDLLQNAGHLEWSSERILGKIMPVFSDWSIKMNLLGFYILIDQCKSR